MPGRSRILLLSALATLRALECRVAVNGGREGRLANAAAFASASSCRFLFKCPALLFVPTTCPLVTMPPAKTGPMKRKATARLAEAAGPRGFKRGKHSTNGNLDGDFDEDGLVVIGEEEGAGAFSTSKSSGYSAATDPETARLEAAVLGIAEWQVKGALKLLADGSTVPFIARYRKEATGAMDEVQLRALQAGLERRQKVGDRRAAIVDSLTKAKTLTPELRAALTAASSLAELEDIYLPLRPKRKTRASDARDKGLEELALVMAGKYPAGFAAPPAGANPYQHGPAWLAAEPVVTARRFLKHQLDSGDTRARGVEVEEALAGARDIVAEAWAEDLSVRKRAREPNFLRHALMLTSKERKKGADAEGNYKVYHDYARPLRTAPPHAVLALTRGERDKKLSIKLVHNEDLKAVLLKFMRAQLLARAAFGLSAAWKEQLDSALGDGLTRLLLPSLERDWWRQALEAAQESSFQTFAVNLRARLLQPPVKGYAVLGIDPGLRTGCKAALVSPTGVLLDARTFFPEAGGGEGAVREVVGIVERHRKTIGHRLVFALGNGKGSREASRLLRSGVATRLPQGLEASLSIVDEGGASVYSASELAGKELGQVDVTMRGAVSIARRLQDPLSELVKIEPKALGVGLYQHDVNQKRLTEELTEVVVSSVNAVGVDVNTASPALLQYVAGLNSKVAQSIIQQRACQPTGKFASRQDIKKVKGMGPKTFLQAAGFLRVYASSEPLDATPIHPESYSAAKAALQAWRSAEGEGDVAAIRTALEATGVEVGEHTLADILEALRSDASTDPRDTLLGVPAPILEPLTMEQDRGKSLNRQGKASGERGAEAAGTGGVSLEDLAEGMELLGVVRNVVAFGSFVDIGVQQDALLHISKMGPGQLQVGQRLRVVVERIERPQGAKALGGEGTGTKKVGGVGGKGGGGGGKVRISLRRA